MLISMGWSVKLNSQQEAISLSNLLQLCLPLDVAVAAQYLSVCLAVAAVSVYLSGSRSCVYLFVLCSQAWLSVCLAAAAVCVCLSVWRSQLFVSV